MVAKYQAHDASSDDVIAVRFQDDLGKALRRVTANDHAVAGQIKG